MSTKKLSANQVRQIHLLHGEGHKRLMLASKFGVSYEQIRRILLGTQHKRVLNSLKHEQLLNSIQRCRAN